MFCAVIHRVIFLYSWYILLFYCCILSVLYCYIVFCVILYFIGLINKYMVHGISYLFVEIYDIYQCFIIYSSISILFYEYHVSHFFVRSVRIYIYTLLLYFTCLVLYFYSIEISWFCLLFHRVNL